MGSKNYRLKKNTEFQDLSKKGQTRFSSHWMILKFKKNSYFYHKSGWTIPKYVGKSHLRNKFKRWLREILENQNEINNLLKSDKYNLNFIFRRKDPDFYSNLKYLDFKKVVLEAVKKVEFKNIKSKFSKKS